MAIVVSAAGRTRRTCGAGFTEAKWWGEGKREVLRSFDPTAEETLAVPRLQGG
jgi:hypothetical protein